MIDKELPPTFFFIYICNILILHQKILRLTFKRAGVATISKTSSGLICTVVNRWPIQGSRRTNTAVCILYFMLLLPYNSVLWIDDNTEVMDVTS